MPSLEQYRLQQFIGACAELDMRVKLVLFGGIKPWLDTLDSIAYLDNFHWYYNLNKVIDSVDLYDELDLDVIGTNAWPIGISIAADQVFGNIPITISTNSVDNLTKLVNATKTQGHIDFFDYHYYTDKPQNAYYDFQQLLAIAPSICIGETGFSTVPRPADSKSQVQWLDYQGHHARTVFHAADALGLDVGYWEGFDHPASAFVTPPTDPGELYYGLYDANNNAKPALDALKNLWKGSDLEFDYSFYKFDTDGAPIGWSKKLMAGTTLTSNQFEQSISLSNCPTGSSELTCIPVMPIIPGNTYEFSCYMAGFNITGGRSAIRISWHAQDGSYIGSNWSASLPVGGTQWTRFATQQVKPPAGTVSAMMHLSIENSVGKTSFREPTFHNLTWPHTTEI
jgi:hypothetical protein